MHPYKIISHQLLFERSMGRRLTFCKTITGMFEDRELYEKLIIFTDEAHFYLNGYVNKQNYRFWGSENPNVSISKPLYPQNNLDKRNLPSIFLIDGHCRDLQESSGN